MSTAGLGPALIKPPYAQPHAHARIPSVTVPRGSFPAPDLVPSRAVLVVCQVKNKAIEDVTQFVHEKDRCTAEGGERGTVRCPLEWALIHILSRTVVCP